MVKTRLSTLRSNPNKEELESGNKDVKYKITDLPFVKYSGKIHYYTDFIDCAMISEEMLNRARHSESSLVLGFDMEWPFSFQTGSGKTALIQISPSLDECFLFHVFEFKKLPASLTELLSHANVLLAGVNIRCDIHKLARDFPGIDSKPMLDNCIDSRGQAKNSLKSQQRWSMTSLVNFCFKMQINKDKKVRNSRWNVIPLSAEQKVYAATDAYMSLKLYVHLKSLEDVKIGKDVII